MPFPNQNTSMIKVKWVVGVSLGASLFASGLTSGQTPAPQPRLICDEPLFDFGVRPNSVEVEHDFIIRNAGDVPLVVSQVRSGCGCTLAHLSQSTIAPGSNAVLSTRLTLRGIVGPKRTSLYLHTNDPEKPVFQCLLAGSAITDLSVSPPQITFTYSSLAIPIGQRLIATGQATSTARITAIEAQGTFFQASIESNAPGYGVILVTPSTNTPAEPQKGMLVISTDHPRLQRLTVPILATVVRDFNAYPEEITLDSAAPETPANIRYVVLRGREDQSFNVTNIVVIPPIIPARLHSMKPAWARLKVGPISPEAASSGAVIRVFSDIPGAAPLDIPVRPVSKRP